MYFVVLAYHFVVQSSTGVELGSQSSTGVVQSSVGVGLE